MENIIEVKNLKYKYDQEDEKYTLNDVSFHVKQGEWLSIVGHNGSGKSTVVRLIDGLLEAESGEIYVDGKQLTRETIWEIRSKIGNVFQNPDNQFVGATVEDDVAFGLENQGIPREEMLQRVEKAIEQVGMLEFKDREPSRLSGGQKRFLKNSNNWANFLSRLCGGEECVTHHTDSMSFLSRLCGGEANSSSGGFSHFFLSRLCGGEGGCQQFRLLFRFLSRLCGGED